MVGDEEGGGEGREGWLYPRMIPRLSRAGFNVLAGSAPESRGRQPSSHQTSPHTRARVYTRVHANTHVYTLNTRARDTYLLRFTELHVRARALLATHPRLFSSVCARTEGEEEGRDERGRRERMERARSGRGRQKRKQRTRGNVGWLAGLRSPRESLLYANYP